MNRFTDVLICATETTTELLELFPETDLICDLKSIIFTYFSFLLDNELGDKIEEEKLNNFIIKCNYLKESMRELKKRRKHD